MKRFIAISLALLALLSLAACGQKNEAAQDVGGWTLTEDGAIDETAQTAFDKAMETLLGVNYTPVALLGTQVVSGTNYCFLCEAAVVSPDAQPYYAVVSVYEDLQGNASTLKITALDLGQIAETGKIEDAPPAEGPLLGGWTADREGSVEAEGAVIHLASQVVSGTNHCVLCKGWSLNFIYEDLDGKTEVTKTVPLDIAALSQPSDSEKTASDIDYMALVNKLNPLPDGWEDAVEIVHMNNSLGDDVEVEKKAYDAYLQLKEALAEEGVFVDLDSARRSIAAQQDIMDRFTEKYGADYAAKTVATPGYSEHHTGLALDLYLNIDGQDVYLNEDMVQYPEIWEKIHEKLPEYGFILRYLEDKEHITGYGYEPWHIRYIDDPDTAGEIMSKGITLEEYLGAVKSSDVTIDYGTSDLYTEEELKEAVVQIKCQFASWEGCELHSIRYAGDACNSEDNISWMNELGQPEDGKKYVQCAEFLMDLHSPVEGGGAWEADMEYKDYQWWLARTEDGGWDVLSTGY